MAELFEKESSVEVQFDLPGIATPGDEEDSVSLKDSEIKLGQDKAAGLRQTQDKVEVLATYAKLGAARDIAGRPAFTRVKIGDGAAWYLSSNLDATGRIMVLESICREAQIEPPIADFMRQIRNGNKYLPGLEVVDRGPYRFLLNHSDKAIILEGLSGYEVIKQMPLEGSVLLAARDVLVLANATKEH